MSLRILGLYACGLARCKSINSKSVKSVFLTPMGSGEVEKKNCMKMHQ